MNAELSDISVSMELLFRKVFRFAILRRRIVEIPYSKFGGGKTATKNAIKVQIQSAQIDNVSWLFAYGIKQVIS